MDSSLGRSLPGDDALNANGRKRAPGANESTRNEGARRRRAVAEIDTELRWERR